MQCNDVETVSIIVCSKDRPVELRKLTGILKEMSATFDVIKEVVIVEAVHSEQSTQFGSIPGVVYVPFNNPEAGFGAIRQCAVEHACGEILVFIDDDCVPCEAWLENLFAPFAESEVVAVGGGIIPQAGNSIAKAIALIGLPAGGLPRLIPLSGEPAESEYLSTGNLALRRTAVLASGGFDTQHKFGGEDQQLVGKLSGKKLFAPAALVEHRNRESFTEVWRWFIRRGKGEFIINKLAGMGIFRALITPLRWSWSWRILFILMLGVIVGLKEMIIFLGVYYLFLFLNIMWNNHVKAEMINVESKRRDCFRLLPLLVAPLVRFCMDFGRETGRILAFSTQLFSDVKHK